MLSQYQSTVYSSEVADYSYGNLHLEKIVLFAVIIVNTVGITRTGINISNTATATDGGQPDRESMEAGQGQIKTLGTTNLMPCLIAVARVVAMRLSVPRRKTICGEARLLRICV